MASDDVQDRSHDDLLDGLSEEQKAQLEEKSFVTVGSDVVWLDRERGLRREPMSRLYYIQTPRGVFRVSRITREVIEV